MNTKRKLLAAVTASGAILWLTVSADSRVDKSSIEATDNAAEPLSLRVSGINIDSAPELHEVPLEEITAPTIIISARDDLFNTLPSAEFAAAKIPGAKLVVYETGGHLLVGREQEVRMAVRMFLAGAGVIR